MSEREVKNATGLYIHIPEGLVEGSVLAALKQRYPNADCAEVRVKHGDRIEKFTFQDFFSRLGFQESAK